MKSIDNNDTPHFGAGVDWVGFFWLITGALTAGILFPLTAKLAGYLDGDGVLPAIISTQKLTWYFWGQDRLLNLFPALASGITDVEWNLRFQLFLRSVAAWLAPLAVLIYFNRSLRFLALATALTNLFLIVCSRQFSLFNLYVQASMFCASLALFAVAYVTFTTPLQAFLKFTLTLAICWLAYVCNFALLTYSIPLLLGFALLRAEQRNSLLVFFLINVAAIAGAKLHSRAFGVPSTTYALSFMPTALASALRNIWDQLRPVPLFGITFLMIVTWRSVAARRRLELLSVLALALAMIVLLANTVWIRLNAFHIRYFLTAEIVISAVMAYVLSQSLIDFTKRKYAVDLGVAVAILLCLVGLGGFNYGYYHLVAVPWRQSSTALAAAAVDRGVRVIIGDYWQIWPAVYDAQRMSAGRTARSPRLYGVAYRGGVMREEFLHDVRQGPQLAFCLFRTAESCMRQLTGIFHVADNRFEVDPNSVSSLSIGGMNLIEFKFSTPSSLLPGAAAAHSPSP